jgi:hypothetical protein
VKTRENQYVFRPSCSLESSLALPLFWAADAHINAPVRDDTAAVIFVGEGVVSGHLIHSPTSSGWALQATAFERPIYVK